MTEAERALLLAVANLVAEWEEKDAGKQDDFSHAAREIRRLMEAVRLGKFSPY